MNAQGEPLIRLRLVPVEVFGTDEACENCGKDHEWGYGLMDAVQAWSDCNRAIGHIYRVDEHGSERWREPGDTVEVWVRQSDMPWFERRFGEGFEQRNQTASPVPHPDPIVTCGDCGRSAASMTEIAWDQYAGRWRCVGGCPATADTRR